MADDFAQPLTDQPLDEQWLSIGDAATRLGVSRDTLRRWEKVGKIKVYRSPTNRRIYKQSELEAVYKQYRQGGSPVASTVKVIPPIPSPSLSTTSSPTSVSQLTPDTPAPDLTSLSPSSLTNPPLNLNQTAQPTSSISPSTPVAASLDEVTEDDEEKESDQMQYQPDIDLSNTPAPTQPALNSPPSTSSSYLIPSEPLIPNSASQERTSPALDTSPVHLETSTLQPSPLTSSTGTQTSISASLTSSSEKPKQTETLKLVAIGLIILLIILGIVITVLIVI